MKLQVAIMAGGSGTRFWPYSTPDKPKQFLDLTGEGTMLQLTVKRLAGLVEAEDIWVLTNEKFIPQVLEQCPELLKGQVIGEPMARDTSAAIALGAGLIAGKDPDAVMAVLPADHVIKDTEGFQKTMRQACQLAEQDRFVTIGIQPNYPAEIYGYLQRGGALGQEHAFDLKSFVEKPSKAVAEGYLKDGNYCWNAGMFVWKTDLLLRSMEQHLPKHAGMAKALGDTFGQENWGELAYKEFEVLEKISIDYGLMEKVDGIAMLEAQFDWNDVGGWIALEDLIEKDQFENTVQGYSVIKDAQNNIIVTQDDLSPTLVVGVKDSIIVNAKAGTLVCHRDKIEGIKGSIEEILSK